MTACDFLVVGAGMAGASAAYELARLGSVVVVEREDAPGYHSTGRSAALLLETYGNDAIRALTVASRRFYENPPTGFAEHPLMTPRGALSIARADQRDKIADELARIRPHVPDIEELGAAEAIRLVPVLRSDYVACALYDRHACDLDVHAIHQGFLKGLKRRGGRVVTGAEATAIGHDGRRWLVETRQGAFAAPVVVNAAGAWCDAVARLAGVRAIGLVPKRRTAITFDAPAGHDVGAWPMAFDIEEHFYFKPEAGRVLASPADATPVEPCDAQPEEFDVAVAAERVERATTMKITRVAHKWAGLRSFVADKTPVVGLDAGAPGFCWLAGQGGYGIMTAPALARATAALATGGHLPDDLARLGLSADALSPARLRA